MSKYGKSEVDAAMILVPPKASVPLVASVIGLDGDEFGNALYEHA